MSIDLKLVIESVSPVHVEALHMLLQRLTRKTLCDLADDDWELNAMQDVVIELQQALQRAAYEAADDDLAEKLENRDAL